MKNGKNVMKAAIFDMDGTLIDSMNEWRRLNVTFLQAQGIEPTEEEEKELLSMTGRMVVDYVKEHFGVEADLSMLISRAVQKIESVYRAGVPLKPGARAYLRRLRERGVKCVLCTATPSRQALIAVNKMDLVKELDYIYCTDMIGGSKGNPAFFDELCALLGEEKENCVMFEDALYAMQGARAAGLGVIGITDDTNVTDREAIRAVCDQVIDSYDELE